MATKSKKSPSKSKVGKSSTRVKKSKAKKTTSSQAPKGEAKSMEELLAQYEKSAEKTSLSQGDKVSGIITEISGKRVLVDFGGKSEGMVAEKAFQEARDYIKTLNLGDNVTASVIIPETFDGYTILSLRSAQSDASWKKIDDAQAGDKPIVVTGVASKSSGLLVDIEGLAGFIPSSQLGKEASKKPEDLVGEHFKAKILETDRRKNKVVLSEREVSDAESIEEIKKAVKKIKLGEIYEGVVTNTANFGCFVQIEVKVGKKSVPVEGLVHISELSWEKVKHPEDVVSEGAKVKVKVLEDNRGRLSLSMKQAQKNPWDGAGKKYKKNAKVEGKVVKQTDFGVFIQLEPGIEGLIHVTKIPPGKSLKVGEEVGVYIEEIDTESKKLSLGLVLTAKPVGYR